MPVSNVECCIRNWASDGNSLTIREETKIVNRTPNSRFRGAIFVEQRGLWCSPAMDFSQVSRTWFAGHNRYSQWFQPAFFVLQQEAIQRWKTQHVRYRVPLDQF